MIMSAKALASPANSNDSIRDSIMRKLYQIHRRARGPRSIGIGVRELQKALRESAGLKQQEVASNLDYLVQKGWVTQVVQPRDFQTPHGTRHSSEKVTYKISHIGIDRMEKASVYQQPPLPASVNITNIRGVTVVGDGNVVNSEFSDLAQELDLIEEAITSSKEVPDEDKLTISADIQSLHSQLQKPMPNKSFIKSLWAAVESAVTAAGFAELLRRASAQVARLIP